MTIITRKRGDTYAETIIVVTAGTTTPIDVTGCTFLLTVDPAKAPADNTNNLFDIVGTILDAPAGEVEFAPSALDADQLPGTYYYDIQMTDGAGRVRTVALDKWVVTQDITK
jgi:hypothetical protein